MKTEYFDTHCHYFDSKFNDYPGGADQAVKDSMDAGVSHFVICSTNSDTARECLDFCHRYSAFRCAIGLHPEDSFFVNDIRYEMDTLRSFIRCNPVVAIGEIGLDYHYPEETDKKKQKEVLDTQLGMAEEAGLPVIIHARDASGDTFDILMAHPRVKGVLHCYSGSPEMARQYAGKGWYFSFGGTLTYPKNEKTAESLRQVPPEQVMLETDCPYLPPVPFRGRINLSAYLPYIAERMSQIWGISTEETAEITTQNALRFFRIT